MIDSKATTRFASEARRILEPFGALTIGLLQSLVQANTVSVPPEGSENAGQSLLQDWLQEQGLTPDLYEVGPVLERSPDSYVRKDRHYGTRKNIQVLLNGSGRGKSLLLNGHMDTVPPGLGAWNQTPWSGHIHNGRLYGLGSFDMKAGLVAQFVVACALRRAGIRLGGDLVCESVVDEEWGGGGGTLAARLRGSALDACVIGEGTQHAVFRATRGGAVVDLKVEAGDSDNYFSSEAVLSPAVHLGRLLQWVETWVDRRSHVSAGGAYSDFRDPAPLQVLAVESNRISADVPFSVPQQAGVRLYFQFLPSEDVAGVLARVRDSLEQFARADPFFRDHPITWKLFYDPPLLGHEVAEDHPWTACLAESVSGCLGAPAVVTAAPYPCDAFILERKFNIPTLLFGPCGAGAHNANEYVEIASLMQTAEVLLAAALQWCGA